MVSNPVGEDTTDCVDIHSWCEQTRRILLVICFSADSVNSSEEVEAPVASFIAGRANVRLLPS